MIFWRVFWTEYNAIFFLFAIFSLKFLCIGKPKNWSRNWLTIVGNHRLIWRPILGKNIHSKNPPESSRIRTTKWKIGFENPAIESIFRLSSLHRWRPSGSGLPCQKRSKGQIVAEILENKKDRKGTNNGQNCPENWFCLWKGKMAFVVWSKRQTLLEIYMIFFLYLFVRHKKHSATKISDNSFDML